jgi:hypothetical protein
VVDGDVAQLPAAVAADDAGKNEPEAPPSNGSKLMVTPEDLYLVCWEYVWAQPIALSNRDKMAVHSWGVPV